MQERCKIAREILKMAGVDDAFIRQKSARARAKTTTPLLRAQSGFFFSQLLGCGQTGDHSLEDIAKFGYRPGMKVKTFKNPSYFWLHCLETQSRYLVIFQKTFVEIWLHEKTKKTHSFSHFEFFLAELSCKLQCFLVSIL
jgi:hypothetical protein